MAGVAEWQIDPAVAAGLERLGWRREDPETRDIVPPLLRGGNVVAVLPPSPAWAGPVIAGLIGRADASTGRVLVLAAPAMVAEWALAVGALAEGTPLRVAVALESPAQAPKAETRAIDLLIASPESALDRHGRSALHPEQFRAIVFAWPEEWHANDAVTALLQDFPKDAQRVVLTSRRDQLDGVDGVTERYARKAVVVGGSAAEAADGAGHATSVRTIAAPWSGRAAVVASVIAAIDPARATIWTADTRDHQLIRRTMGSLREGLQLIARETPGAGMVICYDPPSRQQLATLAAVGEVVLIVPPGDEPYVNRIAPHRRPMQANSPAAAAADRDAGLRHQIGLVIDQGASTAGLYALAPLFEQHDPQSVAAALFTLWQGVAAERAAAPTAPSAGDRLRTATLAPAAGREAASSPGGQPAVAKLWIGAGKRDDATVADFVAVLVREVGVERGRIGRIELRDTFALVEVPAADAESIALRLSGITIRKRKLTAHVDQGRGAPPKRRV